MLAKAGIYSQLTDKTGQMIILLLFFLSSLHLTSCTPDCVVDNKQCLVTGDNFISSTMAVPTSEECGQLCQDNPACTAFTHFGSESHFLSEACMLFSSCLRRGECQDCVTASTQGDCVCSIPYQGVKDAGLVTTAPLDLLGARSGRSAK